MNLILEFLKEIFLFFIAANLIINIIQYNEKGDKRREYGRKCVN